jgi:hypothetical protein
MKNTIISLFQLSDLRVFRKFDRRSLPIIICLLAFVSSAATPGFDTLVNYDTAWTYVYDGGKTLDVFFDAKYMTNGVCV